MLNIVYHLIWLAVAVFNHNKPEIFWPCLVISVQYSIAARAESKIAKL